MWVFYFYILFRGEPAGGEPGVNVSTAATDVFRVGEERF